MPSCPEARFVSKADVKSWPLVSRLVDAAGTLYLEREKKRDALRVVHAVAAALAAGQMVAIFPEGTTSTGHGLLPFHANLLQAAISTETPVQPLALRFSDAPMRSAKRSSSSARPAARKSLAHVVRRRRQRPAAFLAPRLAAGLDRRALAAQLRGDIARRPASRLAPMRANRLALRGDRGGGARAASASPR